MPRRITQVAYFRAPHNVNVNVIVVLNANVLRLDEDRRQRRSGISIWT